MIIKTNVLVEFDICVIYLFRLASDIETHILQMIVG